MRELKQSTAADILVFMVDSADHVSGKTGLTLTITLSKNAGALSSITPTVTERSNGFYAVTLTTSHTDTLGDGGLHITSTGADPTDIVFLVVPRMLADLAFPATSGRSLAVESDGMAFADVREWLGVAPLALSSQRVQALAGAISAGAIDAAAIATGAIDADAIAAGAITSSGAPALAYLTGDSFTRIGAAGAGLTALGDTRVANLDAAVSTRALEAGGNVATVLARVVGTIATGTHQPQSGDSFARIGAAGASLTAIGDTRIANLDATVSSRAVAGDAMILTGAAVDSILDDVVEGALTFRQIVRLLLAFAAGKVTVTGAVRSFRDQADTKNRISGTEDDEGRRTGVTVDGA